MLKLHNSLTKQLEEFKPLNPPKVSMYTCGMTVYDYAHIGHGRKYVNDDVLRRTLTYFGHDVLHVQNVTDVGHLVSDSDSGEDKLEKGAKKFGKTVWEVAEFFTDHFYSSMDQLNILRPTIICKATDHIKEQIEMIQTLVDKGFAYDTQEAVYFDVTKFPEYGKLFGQKLEDKKTAVREEVQEGEFKRNPQDFTLWFKRVGRFQDHTMHWSSPWGDGFPGWHIECSAMSVKYCGPQIDIHTGGEDHLPVHHPNEIAQSEAATGKSPFVKYWLHTSFLLVDGTKMSKSLGNFYTVEDIVKKNIDPIALRYFYLTAHYRKQLNFTFEALEAAQTALNKLRDQVISLKNNSDRTVLSEEKNTKIDDYRKQFEEAISNDLNMPQALAVVWEVVKSNIPSTDKLDLLLTFDQVLGLNLSQVSQFPSIPVSDDVQKLITKRNEFKKQKDFGKADEIRAEIEKLGYTVNDTANGTTVSRNSS